MTIAPPKLVGLLEIFAISAMEMVVAHTTIDYHLSYNTSTAQHARGFSWALRKKRLVQQMNVTRVVVSRCKHTMEMAASNTSQTNRHLDGVERAC